MKKKFLSFLVAGCLVGTTAMPGAVMAETEDLSGTKITFLNTKTEIQDYLEDMGKHLRMKLVLRLSFILIQKKIILLRSMLLVSHIQL